MPIRWRLALIYGLVSSLGLAVTLVVTYGLYGRSQYQGLDRLLLVSVQQAAGVREGAGVLPTLIEPELRIVSRRYREDGQPVPPAGGGAEPGPPLINPREVIANPAGPAFDPLVGLVFIPRRPPQAPPSAAFALVSSDGGRWRALVANLGSDGFLEVSMSLAPLDAAMGRVRLVLGGIWLLGTGLVLLVSLAVAGRALAPVSRLTASARAIAHSPDFSGRLARPAYRDDLGQLSTVLNDMLASLEGQFRQLELITRGAPIGMALLDPELRYLEINQTLARWNGQPRERFIGRKPSELLGEMGAWIERMLGRVLATRQEIIGLEQDVREPSGALRACMMASFYPVFSGGALVAVGCIVQDITERRLAEEQVRRLNDDLERQVIERTREAVDARRRAEALAALGDALQVVRTPEEVTETLGSRIGPAISARYVALSLRDGEVMRLAHIWGELPSPLEQAAQQGLPRARGGMLWRAVLSAQAVYATDYGHQSDRAVPNLEGVSVGVEPVMGVDGNVLGTVSVGRPSASGEWLEGERDLLRRAAMTLGLALERAEHAARLEERMLRAVEAAGVGLWDLDLETQDVLTGGRYAELYGLDPSRTRFQRGELASLVSPEDLETIRLAQQQSVASGRPFEVEFRIRRANGQECWLMARGRPEPATHGPVRRLLGTVMDITSRKRAEERAEHLHALAVRLASSVNQPSVVEAVLEQGLRALDAAAGVVLLCSEDGLALEVIGSMGYAPEAVKPWQRIPLETAVPLTEAVRSGRAVWLENTSVFDARYPAISGVRGRGGHGAWAALPLETDGRVLGVLGLSFAEPRAFDVDDRALALTIADQCAISLERARLFDAESRARRDLERTTAQLEAMLENAPIGLAFFDRDLRFVRVNRELATVNGQTSNAHLNHRMTDLAFDDRSLESGREIEARLAHVLETGQPILNQEMSGPSPHNPSETRYSLASWYPVKLGGDTVLVGAVVTDITERKRLEESLRQSEVRFRRVLERSQAGILEADAAGHMKLVNRRWCEMTGYSEAELLGMTILDVTDKSSREATLEAVGRLAAGGPDFQIEKNYRRKDGSILTANSSVSAVRGPKGEFLGLVAAVLDITERKEAEDRLRRSEERLRLGMKVAHLGLAEVDYATSTVHLTKEAAMLYGLGESECTVTRQQFHNTVHPDEREELERELEQALEPDGEGLFEREHRIVLPSGEERWLGVRKQVFFDRSLKPHRPTHALIAALDITERRRLEQGVRQSEERYRALVQAGDGAVWATPPEAGGEQGIRWWQDLTGQTREQARGFGWLEVVHPDDRTEAQRAFRSALESNSEFELGYRVRDRDGRDRDVAVRGVPVLEADGHLRQWVGTMRDVTERKRAEANATFLAEVALDLAHFSKLEEIMEVVGGKVGAFMGVPYCHFMLIDEAGDEVVYLHRWNASNAVPLPDRVRLSDHITEDFRVLARAGQAVASTDTGANPITKGEANAAINAASFITVPFLRDGQWKYQFSVHDTRPRAWRKDEIELVRELANRVFPRLERAIAEAALREREERYRTFFNAVDEGFCVCEMILDAQGQPVDYRFLEVNALFEEQTGLRNAVGKTALELVPNLEPEWIERYGRVAMTGVPARFEQGAVGMGRVFDVYASGISGADSLRFGILFKDVTERKRAERDATFLASLSEQLRQISDPKTLVWAASRAICEYLGASRCLFSEFDLEAGTISIKYEYTDSPPSMVGTFDLEPFGTAGLEGLSWGRTLVNHDTRHNPNTKAQYERAFRPLGLEALVVVPLSRVGRLVGSFTLAQRTPRRWTDAEVTLIETAAERTWNALEGARTEHELRRSEERFRTLIAATSNVVFTTSPSGEFVPPQPGWVAFTGQSIDEYTGLGWVNAIHPDDRQSATEAWQQSLQEQRIHEHENRLRRFDGEYRTVLGRAVPILDEDGSVREWVGSITDVTERRLAEQSLETQARLLREQADLLALVNETVIVRDPDDHIISWNQAAEQMYGFSCDQTLGKVIHDLLKTEFAVGETRQTIWSALEHDGFWQGELTHHRRDGTRLVVLSRQALQRDTDGKITAILEVNWDITERKQAEEAMRRMADTQKRFVSDASHELRAPLTAIQGNLELLLRYPEMNPDDQREALTEATREAARLGRLVSDLLSLARGDGGAQIMMEEANLKSVLLEAWSEAHHLRDGHTFVLGQLDELEVEGNRDRLKQLALILLDNALKYTPSGGTVRLELRREGTWAAFRVTDTGPGIAPEDLPHVFERFYRVDRSRTHGHDPGGTGLGLPIAQWITRIHGGEIHLESKLGQGTTAVVRLPVLA